MGAQLEILTCGFLKRIRAVFIEELHVLFHLVLSSQVWQGKAGEVVSTLHGG